MGNMVSSLVVYALQAAWFCQRLIDQDYRQNHGSRTKPIMNIDVTDLDVFLSKCRSYYLSKRTRHKAIDYKRNGSKWPWRSGDAEEPAKSSREEKDHFHGGLRQIVLGPVEANGLVVKQEDLNAFLDDTGRRSHVERSSVKTERWKRKKSYYRKRFNPRRGPDRASSCPVRRESALPHPENEDISLDDCLRNDIEHLLSQADRLETSVCDATSEDSPATHDLVHLRQEHSYGKRYPPDALHEATDVTLVI